MKDNNLLLLQHYQRETTEVLNEDSSQWRFDQLEYSLKQNGVDAERSVPILNCSSCFMKYGGINMSLDIFHPIMHMSIVKITSGHKLNFKNKTILWTAKTDIHTNVVFLLGWNHEEMNALKIAF